MIKARLAGYVDRPHTRSADPRWENILRDLRAGYIALHVLTGRLYTTARIEVLK